MSETITIDERSLKKLIKETVRECLFDNEYRMDETIHYPVFLESFKHEITSRIVDVLKKGKHREAFDIVADDCQYVRKINVIPKPMESEDINNVYLYSASYDSLNTGFKDDRLTIGIVTLYFPENTEGESNYDFIEDSIYHELNHIYDDYEKRKYDINHERKTEPLGDSVRLQAVNTIIHDGFLQDLGFLAYYNADSESRALLSTVPMELSRLHINKDNVQIISRQTPTYTEIHNCFRSAISVLSNPEKSPDNYLFFLNKRIKEKYPDAGVPFYKMDFIPDAYRKKLVEWCENVYKTFIKKYYAVVQFYLNEHEKEINEEIERQSGIFDAGWRMLRDTFNPRRWYRFDKHIGAVVEIE